MIGLLLYLLFEFLLSDSEVIVSLQLMFIVNNNDLVKIAQGDKSREHNFINVNGNVIDDARTPSGHNSKT